MRKNEHHVSVYLSDKQFRHLNHIKRTSKLATSTILRKAIMGMEVRAASNVNKETLSEIKAIGKNVNQIAKVANTCGYVNDVHIGLLQQEIEKLKEKVGDEIGDNQDLCNSG